jgi:hypothetical protein
MACFIPKREAELITWADNFAAWPGENAGLVRQLTKLTHRVAVVEQVR